MHAGARLQGAGGLGQVGVGGTWNSDRGSALLGYAKSSWRDKNVGVKHGKEALTCDYFLDAHLRCQQICPSAL